MLSLITAEQRFVIEVSLFHCFIALHIHCFVVVVVLCPTNVRLYKTFLCIQLQHAVYYTIILWLIHISLFFPS